MSTLTQVGNTSIEGNATTLADGDLDSTNDKVIVLDKTNARHISLEDIDKNIQVITCDLSFISIKKALIKIVECKKKYCFNCSSKTTI